MLAWRSLVHRVCPHQYTGSYSGKGRPRTYGGKVDFNNELHLFDFVGNLESGEAIYTARVHSKCLKQWIRVVVLRTQRGSKVGMAILFSTDTELDAMTIIRYYKVNK